MPGKTDRKDNWTLPERTKLVETVLDGIKNGVTIDKSFKVAAKIIVNRSYHSCHYQWYHFEREANSEAFNKALDESPVVNRKIRRTDSGRRTKTKTTKET